MIDTSRSEEQLREIVQGGPLNDIFLALQAQYLYRIIGENSDRINSSSLVPAFGVYQAQALDSFILAVTRLLEREGRYPLQSVHAALAFLKKHASEIAIREPVFLEQAMQRLGAWPDELQSMCGAQQTTAVVEALIAQLPHASQSPALIALKAQRDKRIAHPERIATELLPSPTWEEAKALLRVPIEALAVIGSYLSVCYVYPDDGQFVMDRDARVAAFATHRVLHGLGIVDSPRPIQ